MTAAYLVVAAVHLAALLLLLPSAFPKGVRPMFNYLFNTTFNVSIAELFAMMGVGAIVMGLITLARDATRAYARHRRVDPEPEPVVPAEPQPTPEPAVEVHVVQRIVELLPAAPVRLEEVPLFAQTPVRLPQCDSIDWKFAWQKPTDPFATGSFPEIRLEMEDDAVVPPVPMRGFEARSQFPRLNELERAAVTEALPKPKHRMSKKAVDVDLEAGAVTVAP